VPVPLSDLDTHQFFDDTTAETEAVVSAHILFGSVAIALARGMSREDLDCTCDDIVAVGHVHTGACRNPRLDWSLKDTVIRFQSMSAADRAGELNFPWRATPEGHATTFAQIEGEVNSLLLDAFLAHHIDEPLSRDEEIPHTLVAIGAFGKKKTMTLSKRASKFNSAMKNAYTATLLPHPVWLELWDTQEVIALSREQPNFVDRHYIATYSEVFLWLQLPAPNAGEPDTRIELATARSPFILRNDPQARKIGALPGMFVGIIKSQLNGTIQYRVVVDAGEDTNKISFFDFQKTPFKPNTYTRNDQSKRAARK
jgi:hypothetical protein